MHEDRELEEVGTKSQNHMTYGAWNANYSMIFASWQFLAGCFSRSRHFWPSSLGHLKDPEGTGYKKHFTLPGLFCLDE